MLEEKREGWFVTNVKNASWYKNPAFGQVCSFEDPEKRFPQTGLNLFVLEPGKPNCRYHRESAQEDFLVLSGRCRMLVAGEERELGPWDFAHCPPGVNHVFVGAGEGPCAILMIGHRMQDPELFYPAHGPAGAVGAEAPQPTADPKVAYSDVPEWSKAEPPAWPLD